MNTSSSSCQTGRVRLLLVTLIVASATAAVAAGVALNDRRSGEAKVQRAGAMVAPTTLASPRRAPLSETATTMPGSPLDAATTSGDPSLPAASDVLSGKDGGAEATAPTY